MREITNDETVSITGAGFISTLVDGATAVISDASEVIKVKVGQAYNKGGGFTGLRLTYLYRDEYS